MEICTTYFIDENNVITTLTGQQNNCKRKRQKTENIFKITDADFFK